VPRAWWWPPFDRTLPEADADITIPAGARIVLDATPARVRTLTIAGELSVEPEDGQHVTLHAAWVHVTPGGVFVAAGASSGAPLDGSFTLLLAGDRYACGG
jgi:hypothetical protein